jgi:hypothetical protein
VVRRIDLVAAAQRADNEAASEFVSRARLADSERDAQATQGPSLRALPWSLAASIRLTVNRRRGR